MDFIVLRIEKYFPDKVILMLLGMRMRGCQTLGLKVRAMSIHDLLALGVVRDIRVGVWPVKMVCYGCGESDHMRKDSHKEKENVKESKQVFPSVVEDGPPKRNRFYALRFKGDKE